MILYFIKIFFKRSYKYLLLTFFSIFIGAFLFGFIFGFSKSIYEYFVSEGKILIGGDIVMSSPSKIDINDKNIDYIINKFEKYNQEYRVQAIFKNEKTNTNSPATIRVLENNYPLYGNIEIDKGIFDITKENKIYAEQSFLTKIKADVGDEIVLNMHKYQIAGIIKKEPDSISLGISFAPKVIMSVDNFEKSGISLNQSRTDYKISLKEYDNIPIKKADLEKLKLYAKENKIKIDEGYDGPNNLTQGLDSVKSFSSIVLSIALFLVVINIISNLSYIISKFRNSIAILKSFGATSKQIQIIYTAILSIIGIFSGFFGGLMGAIIANSSLYLFYKYLMISIERSSVLSTTITSSFVGFLMITASSLPFLLSLNNVSPKDLLSQRPAQNIKILKSIYKYISIPILLFIFLFIISKNVYLSLYGVSGLILIFIFFNLISYITINFLYKNKNYFSFSLKSVASSLKIKIIQNVIIFSSIMTAFCGIFIISAIEKNITENLTQNISLTAPSLYLIDINKSQIEQVKKISGDGFAYYPIIRGRLLEAKGVDMTASKNGNITRELNMTYRSEMLKGESVVDGTWHQNNTKDPSVSIDESFAEELGGVKVGEKIKVFIQGIYIDATITSIHSADRTSGTPFFYLIFSPNTLKGLPSSFFATVSGDEEYINFIKNELGNKFPNIIPIQTSEIINTVNYLIQNIVLIIKLIGIPSLILGTILIITMTSQSLYERKKDILVLRVFGLSKQDIIRLFSIEVSFIIMISGLISYLLSHGIAFVLNKILFNFNSFYFSLTPFMILCIILIIILAFVYFISKSIAKGSLRQMLSEK